METRKLHEVHHPRTLCGNKLLHKVQERFKSSHQTHSDRHSKNHWRHADAQETVPEKDQNQQPALRGIKCLDTHIVLQDPVAKSAVVNRSNEYRRQQNEKYSYPFQDTGSGLAQMCGLKHWRMEHFLNNSEVQGDTAGSAEKIHFRINRGRGFQDEHRKKNGELEEFKKKVGKEDREFFVASLPEHHDCYYEEQH